MFISKKKFDEAIKKASCEAEERCWRHYDEDMLRREREAAMRKFDDRLRKVEEKCGLVEPTVNCPCGMTVPSPTYR